MDAKATWDALTEAQARIAALEAENARMRAALKPFADAWQRYDETDYTLLGWIAAHIGNGAMVAWCKRAAAALDAGKRDE